jgi:hypothetical protein
VRHLAALLTVALLAGCAGAAEERGEASLWITRDRGETVLYAGKVAAGQTVMRALENRADVDTRYGGRFVQSIDGIEGSLSGGRDWFYFVNGVAADKGAAEYRLRDGDIAWWDYRDWAGEDEVHVVVGAFPEPFVHGYDGKVRPAVVQYCGPDAEQARELGRLIGARTVSCRQPPEESNVFRVVPGPARFEATAASPDGPYVFAFSGDLDALVRAPDRFRYRYEVP